MPLDQLERIIFGPFNLRSGKQEDSVQEKEIWTIKSGCMDR
jgi:hypothetical protein